jgi:hypothetical protein
VKILNDSESKTGIRQVVKVFHRTSSYPSKCSTPSIIKLIPSFEKGRSTRHPLGNLPYSAVFTEKGPNLFSHSLYHRQPLMI